MTNTELKTGCMFLDVENEEWARRLVIRLLVYFLFSFIMSIFSSKNLAFEHNLLRR